MTQLDLFSIVEAQPPAPVDNAPTPSATVVVFPAERMRAELIAAAEAVLRQADERQPGHARFCRRQFRNLFLRRHIPKLEIDQAEAEFAAALEVEVRRQRVRNYVLGCGQGGAA